MELLAPAGSKEAVVAAIKAGADSVYMGIDKYNARLNSDKLNLYDLEVLTGYAHSKNVKVYLALNTLIKHEEVIDVVRTLQRVQSFNPDALIIQDLGIARVIKEQFPQFCLHASTQMAVHNSAGVEMLAGLGFKRIILARELSKSDLRLIASKSTVELEVFCHGALCFSVSGMCLFSSFIGSRSGNRGWCTQPCRRIWVHPKKHGYLFSPKDLELASQISNLNKIGIKSLKIEGRMRSSEYVYNAVKAYRLLIDSVKQDLPEKEIEEMSAEAGKLLAMDWARPKTTFNFGFFDKTIFNPEKPQCLGVKIGTVLYSDGSKVAIKSESLLKKGDRIRISDPASDQTVNLKITELTEEPGSYLVNTPEQFKEGAVVFKAGDAGWDEKAIKKEVDIIYASHSAGTKNDNNLNFKYPDLIARQWPDIKDKREKIWVRIDDIKWLDLLPLEKIMPVLYVTKENIHAIKASSALKGVEKAACELTPYIMQKELYLYQNFADTMFRAGIKTWVLNNISQFRLVPDDCVKISGHFLYTLNTFSARALKDLGVKYYVVSWEDDFLNIKRMAGSGVRQHLIVYLYGYPAIARSRMLGMEYLEEGAVSNKLNEKFVLKYESGAGIILPESPAMNFTAHRKLSELGIMDFGIDLSFIKPDRKKWQGIYDCYLKNENALATEKFNFKRGLR